MTEHITSLALSSSVGTSGSEEFDEFRGGDGVTKRGWVGLDCVSVRMQDREWETA